MLNRLVAGLLPLVPRRIVSRIARRYVAGESVDEGLVVARDLNRRGCRTTIDLLGEHSRTQADAEVAVREYATLLEGIERASVDGGISVKPTHLGLDLDAGLCLDNIGRLVEKAAATGNFVRIDMEDHRATDATISIYRELRRRHGNVGIVLQSYLRRSLDDVRSLGVEQADVRVCKGIYAEPREIAFQDPEKIRRSFIDMVSTLFDAGARVAIATHDEVLIESCDRQIEKRGLGTEHYEIQMLLGVRRGLRRSLLERGHPMRVYVPYGPEWYEYSLRRLRENPKIVGHVLRATFTRE